MSNYQQFAIIYLQVYVQTTLCMRETKKHGKLTSVLIKYCTTSEPLISWKGMPPDPLAVHVLPTHMQMTDLQAKPL